MKKIINIMFIITLLFLFIPNVYANNALKIESIELDSKSDSTEIINDLSFNDLSINYDVQFKKLGEKNIKEENLQVKKIQRRQDVFDRYY